MSSGLLQVFVELGNIYICISTNISFLIFGKNFFRLKKIQVFLHFRNRADRLNNGENIKISKVGEGPKYTERKGREIIISLGDGSRGIVFD